MSVLFFKEAKDTVDVTWEARFLKHALTECKIKRTYFITAGNQGVEPIIHCVLPATERVNINYYNLLAVPDFA